jgi:hypothetical protein
MRARLSVAIFFLLAAELILAAVASGVYVPNVVDTPQIGVGPAQCVETAGNGECDPPRAPGRSPGVAKPQLGGPSGKGTGSGGGIAPHATAPELDAPLHFFSSTSIWNAPLADAAALDPNSAAIVAALDAEVQREIRDNRGPALNTAAYSVPIYTVPPSQATVQVQLRRDSGASALREAWRAVPLPAAARPAAGTDGHLVVWQPSTDKLWEFWRLRHREDGWHADWGGAMQDVSSSSGVYGPSAWPGATQWWGASACSLSIAGGLITLDDLKRGSIDHAMAMALPQVRAGFYASPAQRTDGTSKDPLSLPEGAHLRLDPRVDVGSLHLPPLTRMIAEAAQRYGFVVRDGASSVALYAQDPTPTGKNPFSGSSGYFEGPRAPLDSFPWQRLQLLEMELIDGA